MSTRSVVAIPDGDGWKGRYVHSDGYPSGVGAALLAGYSEAFDGDLAAMVDKLVTSELVGWSDVCGYDLAAPAQWTDDYPIPPGLGPKSYTARGETADGPDGSWITDRDELRGLSCEWAYVLTPVGIFVHEADYGVGWRPRALVPWDGTAEDMSRIEDEA